jgi:NAD(P)-dependent dehydrogenase (short-subunit alcohol dehydrogenase family)
MLKNIAIIGSSGALGNAFTRQVALSNPQAVIHAFSSTSVHLEIQNVIVHAIDYASENSIQSAALLASQQSPLDLVIVATGILHDGDLMPEKSLKALTAEKMQILYYANTILPAIIAKNFTPHLNSKSPSFFAVLSARVGSISDNQFGGWYSYRASKAALNMIIKNVAIEVGRRNKKAIIVGLHPGTVDSKLTKPYQKNVPEGQLFTAEHAALKLLDVLLSLKPENSGQFFAWDGEEIAP